MFRTYLVAMFAFVAALCSGCSTNRAPAWSSAWQQYYTPSRANAAKMSPRQDVQVRVVDVQQFKDAFAAKKRYFDDRRLAQEDMSAADGVATRRMLLDALRVRDDAETVAVLGVSSFTSPYQMRSDDKELAEFGKELGADFVVVGTEFAGERQGVGMAPVVTTSSGQASANAWGSGGWAQGNAWGTGTSTTFVPVQRTYQQWGAIAMYFRRLAPEERAMMDALYAKPRR